MQSIQQKENSVENSQSTNEARSNATSAVVPLTAIPEHGGASAKAPSDEHLASNDALDADHPANAVWSYVGQTDLAEIRDAIGEMTHAALLSSTDLRVLMSLWLYACIEGVGSARQVVQLSETHPGFRWLRCGQNLDHQTLSDFRWEGAAIVDRKIRQGLVSLWSQGRISIASLRDGCVRVRASNTLKFRRLASVAYLLAEAEERISRLRQEIDTEAVPLPRRSRADREAGLAGPAW